MQEHVPRPPWLGLLRGVNFSSCTYTFWVTEPWRFCKILGCGGKQILTFHIFSLWHCKLFFGTFGVDFYIPKWRIKKKWKDSEWYTQNKSKPTLVSGIPRNAPLLFLVFGLFVSSFCCFCSNQLGYIHLQHSRIGIPFTGLRANISCFLCCYIRGTQRRFPPKNIESSFQAIQLSTFRPLALHSKRRHIACNCSVIPGKFESFRNCKGFGTVY